MSTRRDEWLEAVEALRDEWLEAVELARGPLGLGTERADGKAEALAYAAGRLARILDAVPDVPPAEARVWHLRVGRKVGRTIYEQRGRRPSDGDVLIGLMDTPEWARLVVDAVNAVPDVPPDPPAADREALARLIPPPEVSHHVDDWPQDERDMYRDGDWRSFDERTRALNWHRQLKVADALLSSGVLVDAADVRAREARAWDIGYADACIDPRVGVRSNNPHRDRAVSEREGDRP